MGSCTIMFGFKLAPETLLSDVFRKVPHIFSLLMKDPKIVYPSSSEKTCKGDNLVIAVSNEGKSTATLRYLSNQLLTLDVQHECSQKELVPTSQPYTLEFIRSSEAVIVEALGSLFEQSVSLYTPIRRNCNGPRNYTELGDERLCETDYVSTVYDVMSPYQRVSILQSRQFGRVLTLDDDVMFGESDDIYVTTVLGLDRGNNFGGATVLILGGGDGGLLHKLVSLPEPPSHVTMAEIDAEVMKACRLHMRSVCGDVLDVLEGDNYTILVKDCVEVLKDSAKKGDKYDYVINDLTEFSVNKEQYGFSFDFCTNNIIMELSLKCLKEGGKYLARGNCASARHYVERLERELRELGTAVLRVDRHVPSFNELYPWYSFFEAEVKSCII